jgi:hypothetical protein
MAKMDAVEEHTEEYMEEHTEEHKSRTKSRIKKPPIHRKRKRGNQGVFQN